MKIRPIFNSVLPSLMGVEAITLYPFIFFAETKDFYMYSENFKFIVHEMIHVRQIRKLGVIKFYTQYLFEYFKNRISMNGDDAYFSISFEIEAYDMEYSKLQPPERLELFPEESLIETHRNRPKK